jgi:hypothetical protein
MLRLPPKKESRLQRCVRLVYLTTHGGKYEKIASDLTPSIVLIAFWNRCCEITRGCKVNDSKLT